MKRGKANRKKNVITAYINREASEKTAVRTDEDLKRDYMMSYVKWALQGVYIQHPEKTPIFKKEKDLVI